jgi:rhamnose utilization protein RhaD (predicted bifunctional aldolase and dehydrogenase)
MFDFAELIALSRFAGERFDLVQAGGGNSSVKLSTGELYVKASGLPLGDVANKNDFCCVQWQPLLEFLQQADVNADIYELETQAKQIVSDNTSKSTKRPSIETLMHCALGHFTLHTHPIVVNAITCRVDWRERLTELFKDAFFVEYKTPGASLAVSLHRQLRERDWQPGMPALIFLQNHGLIVADNSLHAVMQSTNQTVGLISKSLNFDLSKYKLTHFVSALVNRICDAQLVSYLSEDQILNQIANNDRSLLLGRPATPDQAVYCGPAGLLLEGINVLSGEKAVTDFVAKFKQVPRVVLVHSDHMNFLFLLGQSLRKCKEAEDVLKSHVLLQEGARPGKIQFLSQSEVDYLTNWEAEKYRML